MTNSSGTFRDPSPPSGAGGAESTDPVGSVLREQRAHVAVGDVVTGVVRVRRRVVTETRTVQVTLRREVLEFDPPLTSSAHGGDEVYDVDTDLDGPDDPGLVGEPLVIELYTEQPVVSTRVVPAERVRIGVRSVPGSVAVEVTTAGEQPWVEQDRAPGR